MDGVAESLRSAEALDPKTRRYSWSSDSVKSARAPQSPGIHGQGHSTSIPVDGGMFLELARENGPLRDEANASAFLASEERRLEAAEPSRAVQTLDQWRQLQGLEGPSNDMGGSVSMSVCRYVVVDRVELACMYGTRRCLLRSCTSL